MDAPILCGRQLGIICQVRSLHDSHLHHPPDLSSQSNYRPRWMSACPGRHHRVAPHENALGKPCPLGSSACRSHLRAGSISPRRLRRHPRSQSRYLRRSRRRSLPRTRFQSRRPGHHSPHRSPWRQIRPQRATTSVLASFIVESNILPAPSPAPPEPFP